MSLTLIRPRFILDAYKMKGDTAVPLSEPESRRFVTNEQAKELLGMWPREAEGPQIVNNGIQDFILPVYTNYRDDSDPFNLYPLSIVSNVKVFVKYDETTGEPVYIAPAPKYVNCGELLFDKSNSTGTKLVVDKLGQISWAN